MFEDKMMGGGGGYGSSMGGAAPALQPTPLDHIRDRLRELEFKLNANAPDCTAQECEDSRRIVTFGDLSIDVRLAADFIDELIAEAWRDHGLAAKLNDPGLAQAINQFIDEAWRNLGLAKEMDRSNPEESRRPGLAERITHALIKYKVIGHKLAVVIIDELIERDEDRLELADDIKSGLEKSLRDEDLKKFLEERTKLYSQKKLSLKRKVAPPNIIPSRSSSTEIYARRRNSFFHPSGPTALNLIDNGVSIKELIGQGVINVSSAVKIIDELIDRDDKNARLAVEIIYGLIDGGVIDDSSAVKIIIGFIKRDDAHLHLARYIRKGLSKTAVEGEGEEEEEEDDELRRSADSDSDSDSESE